MMPSPRLAIVGPELRPVVGRVASPASFAAQAKLRRALGKRAEIFSERPLRAEPLRLHPIDTPSSTELIWFSARPAFGRPYFEANALLPK